MHTYLLILSLILSSIAFSSDSPAAYAFPEVDSITASIAGNLLLPEKAKSVHRLKIKGPMGKKLRVSFYPSSKPSNTLHIIIAGIGGDDQGGISRTLAASISKEQGHVLSVPSSFTKDFAYSFSSTGYVGLPSKDAWDYIEAFKIIKQKLVKKFGIEISKTKLIGYSLGALTAAHMSSASIIRGDLDFDQVILINPPLDLLYGMRFLDKSNSYGKEQSALNGVKKVINFFKLLNDIDRKKLTTTNFNKISNKLNFLTEKEGAFYISSFLKDSLKDVILASQNILDLDILPKLPPKGSSLYMHTKSIRAKKTGRYGFVDHSKKFLLPFLRDYKNAPDLTLKDINEMSSMYFLKDHLEHADSVFVFHNADDFLLKNSDIDFIKDTFKSRAKIYPRGGHLGNIWFKKNQADLLSVLSLI